MTDATLAGLPADWKIETGPNGIVNMSSPGQNTKFGVNGKVRFLGQYYEIVGGRFVPRFSLPGGATTVTVKMDFTAIDAARAKVGAALAELDAAIAAAKRA